MSNDEFAIALYGEMEVLFDEQGDPWLTQNQIANMFGISRQNVGNMLSFALENEDIDATSVCNLRLQAADGKSYNVKHYDFDAVLIVGYRSKATKNVKAFRRWVSSTLKQHVRNLRQRNEHLAAALQEESILRLSAESEKENLLLEKQEADKLKYQYLEEWED